jgi:Mg-chelatase subunit ChlD
VQTLEPESIPGLERERDYAQDRAKKYERTVEQLKEARTAGVEHFGDKAAEAGQDQQLARQLSELQLPVILGRAAEETEADAKTAVAGKAAELRSQINGRSEAILNGVQSQVEAQKSLEKNPSDRLADLRDQQASEDYRGVSPAKADTEKGKVISKTLTASVAETPAAAPEKPLSFWGRLSQLARGEAEKSARVEIGRSPMPVDAPLYGANSQNLFDPYFVQTDSEKIKSKMVLYRVIEKLHLNESWAGRNGGSKQSSTPETYQLLAKAVDVQLVPNSRLAEIRVKSDTEQDAARIANTIADVYRQVGDEERQRIAALQADLEKKSVEAAMREYPPVIVGKNVDAPAPKLAPSAPIPQPEVSTTENPFSTFSLNVTDVAFKLAAANLEKGLMPDPATVRSEEFLNAFDYRDPEPPAGVPVAFAWERSRYPFAHNRDLLRFSIKTVAEGRQQGYPLNLVLVLDKSGSMERADRVQITREALRVLAGQLQPQDKLSIITFARTARLWADGVKGSEAGLVLAQATEQTPEGGTNLEDALNLAYQTALKHYIHGGGNRVILLTDGAANLGNVEPEALQHKVEANRKQGVALDCFGVGWEGYNDDLLEVLSSHGDGRYGFLNTPEEAGNGFAGQLAGALRVAAADVKVQVEFNPKRVSAYRQIGYAKHQLAKEQFRDNTVDAGEIGAAESGNALYVVQVNGQEEGDLGVVRVRYKLPSTGEVREQEWAVPYTGGAVGLEQASPAMRLAAVASSFAEWLVSSPYTGEVTPDRLLALIRGVPEVYGADSRPTKLEWMIRQAKSISGK